MIKMHLAGKPVNEGARRLAWWIGDKLNGCVDLAAQSANTSVATVERLLAGEIVPGTDLALPIGLASDGYILRRDWQRPAEGGWFKRPSSRPSIAELAVAA